MKKPLDELYLTWLYAQIGNVKLKNRSRTYWTLARQLYTKEFVWFIPNDDNRAEDGRDLRCEFLDQEQIEDVDEGWMELGCSVLEMLIGLSRRLSFEDDREPRVWFWCLIDNIGLLEQTDNSRTPAEHVDEILNKVIWRTYKPSGRGGLFPLRRAERDQREVEIWYQLSAYLLESN